MQAVKQEALDTIGALPDDTALDEIMYRLAIVTVLDEPSNGAPEPDTLETTLLSEQSLSVDWARPEEDEAWSHLR